jgi:catechol 2,3-dioxygenase-like lactoylglutathione lyase family enzyme
MKRLHVNLSTADLDASVRFYTHLFDCEPTVLNPDYAKWMLDDPRVNFSLAAHSDGAGVDHLGIEAEDAAEFATLRERAHAADKTVFEQPDVVCCYAQSSKAWARDPNGVSWETFVSHATSDVFGDGSARRAGDIPEGLTSAAQCCGPDETTGAGKCCA